MSPEFELSRRSVLTSAAAAGIAGIAHPFSSQLAQSNMQAGLVQRSDFVFPPNMTYVNTGSVGPSPKIVLEKMVSTWHLIESSPVAESYA